MDPREILSKLADIGPKVAEVFTLYSWYNKLVLVAGIILLSCVALCFAYSRISNKDRAAYRAFKRLSSSKKIGLASVILWLTYTGYLVTAGRPSPWELEIFPGYYGRTSEGYMQVRLYLANLSAGGREIHNVMGTYWIFGVKLIQQSGPPSSAEDVAGNPRSEYPINVPLLPKSSGAPLIEWLVEPPKPGETGAIGWNFVSSETSWQAKTVMIVTDAKGPHLQSPKEN
jgi:hypothetical protein